VFAGYGLSWLIGISVGGIRNFSGCVRGASVIGVLTVTTIAISWCAVQSIMVDLIPPGEFAGLIAALRQHPGATVVANTYAAPFFISTGAWAYLDSKFGTARIARGSVGYDYVRDTTYLWLADGTRNPEYSRPSLYVCSAISSLAERMEGRLKHAPPQLVSGCGSDRLVELAKSGGKSHWPSPQLLATDPTGGNRWAIVANDYDFPPYVDGYPDAIAAIKGSNLEVAVDYRYRHQAGLSEAKSRVSLIAFPAEARNCRVGGRTLVAAEAQSGHAHLVLPISQIPIEGALVVSVEPATATRRGFAEYSLPIDLSSPARAGALNCSVNQRETTLR
jgi:hypothetical protein